MTFTKRIDPAVRFGRKYLPLDDGCWLWIGSTAGHGYGEFYDGQRKVPAHRWAYEHFIGPIPDGLQLDHLCRVRPCVNPEHLEPVTQAENIRRGAAVITHCPQGHPYDEANTCRPTRGNGNERQCRTCARERMRARKHRQQVAASDPNPTPTRQENPA